MNSYLITIMQADTYLLKHKNNNSNMQPKKSNIKNDHSIHFSRIIIHVNE